jgi:hypothetical protein
MFKHHEAFSFQVATDDQAETKCDRGQRRRGERLRLARANGVLRSNLRLDSTWPRARSSAAGSAPQ